jgi:hypothetical protein
MLELGCSLDDCYTVCGWGFFLKFLPKLSSPWYVLVPIIRLGGCSQSCIRYALWFNRFCSFLLSEVLDLPVQSSFPSLISSLWHMGRISIMGKLNGMIAISFRLCSTSASVWRAITATLLMFRSVSTTMVKRIWRRMQHADGRPLRLIYDVMLTPTRAEREYSPL